MARKQLKGFSKFIDSALFGGAEQKTIAHEQKAERQQFIKDYRGEFEIDDGHMIRGSCDCGCGRSLGEHIGSFRDEDGKLVLLAEHCVEEKVEQYGYDTNQLPWNRWKLPASKRPTKLG